MDMGNDTSMGNDTDMDSGMDMDDGSMDDGSMDMSSGHGDTFYVSTSARILFEGAETTTVGGIILAFVIVFVVSVLYEIARKYKTCYERGDCSGGARNMNKATVIELKKETGAPQNGEPPQSTAVDRAVSQEGMIDCKAASKGEEKVCRYTNCRYTYILVCVLAHMLLLTISYFIMLVAMTFNTWLFLAIILGSGCGKAVVMIGSVGETEGSDHCNMP